ncbi:glycosyltransferase family 4 protein [Hymenobacter caeli]|uniref:Glycosyltransferase involved in cell wall biosynthesis n=1 Tax=Hymenobacter caeli TaxID=2735894 RepID=A0ABX2FL62_9BACT|nr:glycosyltransferase family 4 protein [Hymenobacter caeli]NRT17274.1 glycosyltransferase involved in cell wall biosynthesis [Hymenobacter caeli]
MNILISTWSLQVGGGEILAMNLAAGLDRLGHRVVVFNQRAELHDAALVQRLLPPGVRVVSMADRPRRSYWAYKLNALGQRLGLRYAFYERAQQAYFRACLKRYGIELVNSHATYSDRLCAPGLREARIPFVITEHGEYTMFARERRPLDFAPVLRQADALVTVSDYCRLVLQGALEDLPPVHTIFNGIRVDAPPAAGAMRAQLGIGAGAFVYGMVARGIAEKGWEAALLAFRALRPLVGRDVQLVLVGGSGYLDDLRAQYAAEPGVHFVGRVPNPDFYVAGFDVGLLPSYFAGEALPLAVIEYLFYDKPVVATDVGGMGEILLDAASGDAAGLLTALDHPTQRPDVPALTAAMRRYATDAALYAAHQQVARRRQATFSLAGCVRQYEALFEQVVAGRAQQLGRVSG